MKIEKAKNIDAKKLTELTIRSKSHWNYSPEQIKKWKDDLTITVEYIERNEVYKLINNNRLIGYYSFVALNAKDVKLDNIFIDPNFIGMGYGSGLMNDFFERISNLGFEKVILDSEPNTEKFYEKIGFKVVGKLESSIKNRFLPIMELEINTAHLKK